MKMRKSVVKDNWETKKIGEIGRVITGKTPPTKVKKYYGSEYPFITPTDITGANRFVNNPARYLSREGFEYQKSLAIPNNAICFTCIASIGKIAITNRTSFTNQQINSIIVDSNIADYRYIFYLLKTQADRIKNYSGGVASPIISKSIFEEISIPLPPLPVQKKIASILSAYDDLIELNERRIKILEEMARLIYKEWFVKFRFPGYKKVKMVESELDPIPEGWERKKIGETLRKLPRKKKVKKEEYLETGEIPIIDQGRDFIGGYTNDIETKHTEPLPIIVFGDHTRILKYIDFPFTRGADGTQRIYPKGENLTPAYLYFALKNVELSNYAYARHFKYLKEEEILVPKIEIVHEFDSCVSVLLNQMSLLRKQNQRLKEVRDMLLPKLMSSEIRMDV